METNILISCAGVGKTYGSGANAMQALQSVDLDIATGEFVAMMGPSGSGKSTLLNILGCIDIPSSGSYQFEDVRVERLSRDKRALLRRHFLGFIFQGFNLLNRTSALENVELPLIYRKIPPRQRRIMALEALATVGLERWWQHTPGELSGGQQQRVAIARAIVGRPRILLADEPTGNLDTARSIEIIEMLRSFNRSEGITIVMVTHEADMAAYADRRIQFQDGRIVEDSSREVS
ncbi:ABC transporter ATP-binding protein [Desulfofustis glycolicus]|uniref:Putative ABC transport system ATP-binding protein n=1 Tax=Desulfofustis glycolicus DSM 9705 TaxID=1121409 RepID=A0A1M5YD08_9BACT|nr:ABC transporter ATP-binding protein [Desulfofustis glycolicus]MCB2215534.1 ABC transporter ATP-binding protein [Desulfobulbaceae bacterium]SHI09846.1 putative ABC transport system ATP-binding protein [Desulfofustis glycolicus DSM 9705]